LAGPGEDAEGVDAGELAYHENAALAAPAPVSAVTASLWKADGQVSSPIRARSGGQLARVASTAIGRGMGAAARGARGRSGAGGGVLAAIPATPELLAKVAALPPADDQPRVSRDTARAPDP